MTTNPPTEIVSACPFCETFPMAWGMSQEGWDSMKRWHDAGHPQGTVQTFGTVPTSNPTTETVSDCEHGVSGACLECYSDSISIEPEYKRQVRRIIESNMVHANFEALFCSEDKYTGCLGHKQKHIDIMVEKIWNMFRPIQITQAKGEEKKL